MNPENLKLCEKIINKSYIDLASNSINSRENLIKNLLAQKCLPINGWDDLTIELFLTNMAEMDSNNYPNKIGAGERESRLYSKIVEKRHFYMGHGVGRSGDLSAVQPKAAGSSIIAKIAKSLTIDAIKQMGYQFINDLLLVPCATGMTITLALLALQKQRPNAKYVIWPRIDQKTCLKCIITANLQVVVIENKLIGDEIVTDVEEIEKQIVKLEGENNILCVLSTTSCFAARTPDKLLDIGNLCKKYNIFHVINNAYGLQCSKIAFSINQATKHSRVDVIISSTDKNFMVPIGGALIYSQNAELIKNISNLYPGRANASPIVDLLITLLSMGKNGLKQLLEERKQNYKYLKEKLQIFASKYGEKVLEIPNNNISIAVSLSQFKNLKFELEKNQLTFLGSIFYAKRIMGARIITLGKEKNIEGYKFMNYGSHINNYNQLPYFTIAAAIGMKQGEINMLCEKLEESLNEFKKKLLKDQQIQQQQVEITQKDQNLQTENQQQQYLYQQSEESKQNTEDLEIENKKYVETEEEQIVEQNFEQNQQLLEKSKNFQQ